MRSSTLHFGNVPHPWALPIIKHEAKFIMNHTYVNHKVNEWGGLLGLLFNKGRVLIRIGKHNLPPTLEE
jgi:hypothetical protein